METVESLRSRLKGAVGVNTDEALFEMEKELSPDSKFYSEFLICKNEHRSIDADYYKGVIAGGERRLRHARLLISILALIDRFGRKDLVSLRDDRTPLDELPPNEPAAGAWEGGANQPAHGRASAPPAKAPTGKPWRRLRAGRPLGIGPGTIDKSTSGGVLVSPVYFAAPPTPV